MELRHKLGKQPVRILSEAIKKLTPDEEHFSLVIQSEVTKMKRVVYLTRHRDGRCVDTYTGNEISEADLL